jgi:hypothetical protein
MEDGNQRCRSNTYHKLTSLTPVERPLIQMEYTQKGYLSDRVNAHYE